MNKYIYCLLPLLLTLFSCSSSDQPSKSIEIDPFSLSVSDQTVVAKVGSEEIKSSELVYLLTSRAGFVSEDGKVEKALDELIDDEIFYQKAVENGFHQSPEYVVKERKLLAQEYRQYIKKKSKKEIIVTEQDVENFYKKNKDKYTQERKYRLAVYMRRNDSQDKKHKLTLDQVAESAKHVALDQGFGRLSLDSDDLRTRDKGGKLGWTVEGSVSSLLPKEVQNKGEKLDVGDVSSIINTSRGSYLVRKIGEKKKKVTPLESVASEITRSLLAMQQNELLNSYQQQAKKSVSVEKKIENLKTEQNDIASSDEHLSGPPGFPIK